MVKPRTWFALFMVSVGTIAATASCGSDEGIGGAGGGGSIISGGGSHAGTVGRAGSGGGSGASASNSLLGGPCASDGDCGDGLVCATGKNGLFGGDGPANGMCTKACTVGGNECDALKTGAQCLNLGTPAEAANYCLESCTVGTPLDLSTKCSGRPDFLCFDSSSLPAAICLPHCRADADCETGLYCDKSSALGLCTKTKPTGDPVGSACTPGASTSTCAAVCLRTSPDGVSPVTGVCAESCAMGAECMYGPGATPDPGGFCWGALSPDAGIGDRGYCLPNCSCSGDCLFPSDVCNSWPSDFSDIADAVGAPGVCSPFAIVDNSVVLSCGEGGAGGAAGAAGAAGEGPVTPSGGSGGSSGGTGGSSGGTGGSSGGSSGGGGTGG